VVLAFALAHQLLRQRQPEPKKADAVRETKAAKEAEPVKKAEKEPPGVAVNGKVVREGDLVRIARGRLAASLFVRVLALENHQKSLDALKKKELRPDAEMRSIEFLRLSLICDNVGRRQEQLAHVGTNPLSDPRRELAAIEVGLVQDLQTLGALGSPK